MKKQMSVRICQKLDNSCSHIWHKDGHKICLYPAVNEGCKHAGLIKTVTINFKYQEVSHESEGSTEAVRQQ